MDWTVRQVQQNELSRRDLHHLAFLPYRYTAHQVALKNVRHWAIAALTLTAFAALLQAGGSVAMALAGLVLVPAYVYAHSRAFDFLVIQSKQPDYGNFASFWDSPNRVYVAECNRTKVLLGIVCLQRISDAVCDLQHAAVKPAHRRNGLGSRLMTHAISEAARLGYSKVTLYSTTVQAPAVNLYKKLGFRVDSQHSDGVRRRIPFLPKPFEYVNMSLQLNTQQGWSKRNLVDMCG